MSEYTEQANSFLAKCNASIEIRLDGLEAPLWDKKKHLVYDCSIVTPKGTMKVRFYDSLAHTEIRTMTAKEFYRKYTRQNYDFAMASDRIRYQKMLKEKQTEAVPSAYDILACLQKCEVGDMDDFMRDYGYEIKCVEDMTNFFATYNAVVKEYNDVRRCFTEQQIHEMQEIA